MIGTYTMTTKGNKQHNVAELIEAVKDSEFKVILVDCGELMYPSGHNMGNSIKTMFTRRGIKIKTMTIDEKQILIFKE